MFQIFYSDIFYSDHIYDPELLFTDGSIGKSVIMSLSVHIDNKIKDILILGEGPTQGFDYTTLTAEAIYAINFTQPNKRFALSLHYNGSNSCLFVNATKIYHFKAKSYEIVYNNYALCLDKFQKDFAINNVKKNPDYRGLQFFSVLFNPIGTNYILDIHKYLR